MCLHDKKKIIYIKHWAWFFFYVIMSAQVLMRKSLPYFSVCLKNNKNKAFVCSILNSQFFVLKALLEIAHNILKQNVALSPGARRSLLPFKEDLLHLLIGPWSKQKLAILFKVHQGRQLLKTLVTIGTPLAKQIASDGY